jgi:hypothetical protein
MVIVATSSLRFFLFFKVTLPFYDVRIFDYVDDSVGVVTMLNDERLLLLIENKPNLGCEKAVTESGKYEPS